MLDCKKMHKPTSNDQESWDDETPYVIEAVGDFQAVYSSEPDYGDYFKRAYPFAKHILIDVPRIHVPISGTAIRGMNDEEAAKWIVR